VSAAEKISSQNRKKLKNANKILVKDLLAQDIQKRSVKAVHQKKLARLKHKKE
jgi:hypothetical protein